MLKEVFRNFEEVNIFLVEEKYTVYTLIIDGIKECLKTDTNYMCVAEFLITDEDVVFKVEMTEADWYESLHLALYYFEGIEEYERCSEISELISELYG